MTPSDMVSVADDVDADDDDDSLEVLLAMVIPSLERLLITLLSFIDIDRDEPIFNIELVVGGDGAIGSVVVPAILSRFPFCR